MPSIRRRSPIRAAVTTRRRAFAAIVVVVGVGCGGSAGNSGSTTPGTSVVSGGGSSSTTSTGSTIPPVASTSTTTATSSSLLPCAPDQLELVAGFVAQLGGLKLRNTSTVSCTLSGRPVVTRVGASGASLATADSVFHRAGEPPEPVAPIVLAARAQVPDAVVFVEVCADPTPGERFGVRFDGWPAPLVAPAEREHAEACGGDRSLFASDVVRTLGAGGVDAPVEGPSSGGWWHPSAWTEAGEEEGASDPLADGRYVGLVTSTGSDTIGFDLVTTAPSDSDRQAAVKLGLLRPADAEFDGAIINARSKVRVMRVAVDARLRRLEPFGTPNLVFVPRSDLAALVAISSRSASAFYVEVRSGVVTAMDERYHP